MTALLAVLMISILKQSLALEYLQVFFSIYSFNSRPWKEEICAFFVKYYSGPPSVLTEIPSRWLLLSSSPQLASVK